MHPCGLRRRMSAMLAGAVVGCTLLAWLTPANAQVPTVLIRHPLPEQTIHDNTGSVRVSVALQGLALGPGDRLRVLIDGQPYGPDQFVLDFTLQDVKRGEHTLQVQVVDAKSIVVVGSSTIKFHLWRASALFPARKPGITPGK